MEQIRLSEVLLYMAQRDAQGLPLKFNITVRTYNKFTKKGGELNEYFGAVISTSSPSKSSNNKGVYFEPKEAKFPNHIKNRTRNILLPNGEIKKIGIRRIITFNNKTVVY